MGPPFGLEGFVKVRSLSGETAHLSALKSVCIKREDGAKLIFEKVLPIEKTMCSGEFFLIKFLGIDSPEAAAELRGAKLMADRSQAAPLREGEFYVEDLKGLTVIAANFADSENEEVLGSITDIIEGGGGELVELKLLSGETKLVPFRKEFIADINIESGRMILREKWILE